MEKVIGFRRFFTASGTVILVLLVSLYSIPNTLAQTSIPSNAVELRVGIDMSGISNLTLDGTTNVPIGCLCEIRNSASDAILDTFYVGHGTEGPPGVFKDGQFDFFLTVSPNPYESATISIYIRVYNQPTSEAATRYGDSQIMTVVGGNTYNIPGWMLSKSLSSVVDDDDGGGDGTDEPGDPIDEENESPFWKNPLIICLLIALLAIVMVHYVMRDSKPPKSKTPTKPQRRRNSKRRR